MYVYLSLYIYIYIYTYIYNATCPIRPRLSDVFLRVKEHHDLLNVSLPLKKSCFRQVVLDKWFPLSPVAPLPPLVAKDLVAL